MKHHLRSLLFFVLPSRGVGSRNQRHSALGRHNSKQLPGPVKSGSMLLLLTLPGILPAQEKRVTNLPEGPTAPAVYPAMPKPELQLVSPVGPIDTRVEKLHATVALTAEQQKKIKAVLAKNDQAMQAAVAAFRSSRSKETRQALAALMKAQNNEINAILTDAQKARGETAQNVIPGRLGAIPGSFGPGTSPIPGGSAPQAPGVPAVPPTAGATRPAAKPAN